MDARTTGIGYSSVQPFDSYSVYWMALGSFHGCLLGNGIDCSYQ